MRTMDLHTRVAVYCRGKAYGILRKVVVDPDDGHITDLVVEPSADPSTVRIVPVSLVTFVDINQVHLGLSAKQIDSYPTYPQIPDKPAGRSPFSPEAHTDSSARLSAASLPATLQQPDLTPTLSGAGDLEPERGPTPPPQQPGVERLPWDESNIEPGTPVLCADGQLTLVNRTIVDPQTRRLTHLALHNPRASSYRVIPVRATVPGGDGLLLTPATWNDLPPYVPRTDKEIHEEIRETVFSRLIRRGENLDRLDLRVEGGLVTLLGTLKEQSLLRQVIALVSAIPGVISLRAQVDLIP